MMTEVRLDELGPVGYVIAVVALDVGSAGSRCSA
jgi:hypothetical protein